MWISLLFAVAILFLIMVPFTPQLVRLRIRLLRWLNWTWAVNVMERHFQGWVLFFRMALIVLAAVLFYVAWTQH